MVSLIKYIHTTKIDHINKKTVYWLLNLEMLKPKSPLKVTYLVITILSKISVTWLKDIQNNQS